MAAPALLALLARSGGRRSGPARLLPAPPGGRAALAAVAALLAAGALIVLVLLASGAAGVQCADSGSGASGVAGLSEHAKKEIPQRFVAIYVAAAQKFGLGPQGWSHLASIHKHENGFSDSGGSPTSTAGALGPMQFLASTWASYGADGDGDGIKNVQDVDDAIFGAANYLSASGAPDDWPRAIFAYNHADWYVDLIKATALDYLGHGPGTTYASVSSSCTCGAGSDPGEAQFAVDRGGGGGEPLPGKPPRIFWPTPTKTISSQFGMRWGRLHAGVDVPVPEGTPLTAAAGGRVVSAGWVGGYGNYTCIQHARTFSTCYAHQSQLGVRAGQTVTAGQRIGLSGNTGNSTGPHLHFEIRTGPGLAGTPVDPAPYLQGAALRAGGTMPASAQESASCGQTAALIDGGELLWPLAERRGRLAQGPYTGTHTLGNWQSDNAVDIAVPVNTPVVAVAAGRVCTGCRFGGTAGSGTGRFDGMRLTLDIAANQVFYTHLRRLARGMRPGTPVKRGQVIGWTWMANSVPHLHVAVRDGDVLALFGLRSLRPASAA